jgi:hypothetical protein
LTTRELLEPIRPSIGAMVELWIQAWDKGWWYAEAPKLAGT